MSVWLPTKSLRWGLDLHCQFDCKVIHGLVIACDFYGEIFLFSNIHRLTPKNVHQRPTVVLLCGPHVQGAQGISCGRHLANHEVEVILFLPNFVKMQESVTSEVNLFSKTSGKQVSSVKGKTPPVLVLKPTQVSTTLLEKWGTVC